MLINELGTPPPFARYRPVSDPYCAVFRSKWAGHHSSVCSIPSCFRSVLCCLQIQMSVWRHFRQNLCIFQSLSTYLTTGYFETNAMYSLKNHQRLQSFFKALLTKTFKKSKLYFFPLERYCLNTNKKKSPPFTGQKWWFSKFIFCYFGGFLE